MALKQLSDEVKFKEKDLAERDELLRNSVVNVIAMLAVSQYNEDALDRKIQNHAARIAALELENTIKEDRIAELERKIGILQNKCKVSLI